MHRAARFVSLDAKPRPAMAVQGCDSACAGEAHIEGKLVHRDRLVPWVEDQRLGTQQQRPFHPVTAGPALSARRCRVRTASHSARMVTVQWSGGAAGLLEGVDSRHGVRNHVRGGDAELIEHDVVVPKHILCHTIYRSHYSRPGASRGSCYGRAPNLTAQA